MALRNGPLPDSSSFHTLLLLVCFSADPGKRLVFKEDRGGRRATGLRPPHPALHSPARPRRAGNPASQMRGRSEVGERGAVGAAEADPALPGSPSGAVLRGRRRLPTRLPLAFGGTEAEAEP